MAAGDLINASLGCYQIELRAMLIANGQSWYVRGFTGLSFAAKENVYSLGHDSGSVVGPEFTESLLLSWDVQCNTTTGRSQRPPWWRWRRRGRPQAQTSPCTCTSPVVATCGAMGAPTVASTLTAPTWPRARSGPPLSSSFRFRL